ncbi:MAG: spermidine synthase [Bryobacteraceae bacterium]
MDSLHPTYHVLFPVTIFLSAFLLFQVQPMIGRYILPWFGGGPAVWTGCLLFFQACLLAGYTYAHWLGSLSNVRLQAGIHIGLLLASLLFLPLQPNAAVWRPPSGADPSARILLLLTVTVGGPYLLLSATAPLVQRWFTIQNPEKSPWRLYALSNFGSFLALLSYPFVFEPLLRLRTQGAIWSGLYLVFAALCGFTAWRLRRVQRAPVSASGEPEARPTTATVLFWLGLSTCGSTLLVATTNQISQDIAVSPFLWVAALAIYLLTFVLAFESDRFYRRTLFAIAAGLFAPVACAIPTISIGLSLRSQLLVYLITLFVTCMICQGELARSRPSPRYLTTFYLTIAAGGALGGVFVALIAPRIFTEFSEYPIGLAAVCLFGFAGWVRTGAIAQWTSRNFAVRLPLMALLIGGFTALAATVTAGKQGAVASARNFYGILRVTERQDNNGAFRELQHGRTRHGIQYLQAARKDWPTSYYGPHSGVAMALNALDKPDRRIAVVGLGAGTLAAWGHAGDTFRFYEINPDVERIARTWFSYLGDSKAQTEVVLGDARVQLAQELASGQSQDFDLIAVDAFSGDAIPMHLLTAECADIYRRRLKPGGVLALHISNRALNLDPVARGMASYLGWTAVQIVSADDPVLGESSSHWVLLASNPAFFERAGLSHHASGWSSRAPILWTDDFASLWHVLTF